jgi:two-component system response regulator YesN
MKPGGRFPMLKVLIVDDEPVIRKGLQKLIRQSQQHADMAIFAAENGEEALQAIAAERPDFIFTDIRMPKMDGLELCRRIAELESDTQVVIISGYGDFEYAQKCLSYGVKEYLLKPVSRSQLEAVLAKLIEQWNKKRSSSFVSVARLERWVELLEEAVWTLQTDALEALLHEGSQEITAYGLTLPQQRELLGECFSLLLKKLDARDVFPAAAQAAGPDFASDEDGETFGKFREAVLHLCGQLRAKRKGKLKDPVEEAKTYIEQHIAAEVSLEEVAEQLGLNPSYFSQLFKQTTGETFVQYRTRRRMEKAKKLLESPHYRITDISYEVGYSDHPHFTKTFKKVTGYSPSEYRQKLGIE